MKKITILFIFLTLFLVGCGNAENTQENNTSTVQNTTTGTRLSTQTSSEKPQPKTEQQISTFSTSIRPNEPSREKNISIGCNQLNGTIVKAGETFSFCDTLGPATPDKGYEKAETFDNKGNIIMEYGGGKCQISSTLYNSVLALPSLTVVERYPHSNKVDYVDEGKDATVCYGSVDFKFKNDNNFDIKITATSEQNTLTVSLFKI